MSSSRNIGRSKKKEEEKRKRKRKRKKRRPARKEKDNIKNYRQKIADTHSLLLFSLFALRHLDTH